MLDVLSRNIIFIGFMGSGKSTVGRAMSKRLYRLFFDTDAMIEDRENKSISDIFKEDGEDFFRKKEAEVSYLLHKFVQTSVIATGGGLPTAIDDLKDLGIVYFLDIDFDLMLTRMRKEDIEQRPLLQDIDKARDLYNSRKEIYKSNSHCTIKIKDQDISEIVEEVIDYINCQIW